MADTNNIFLNFKYGDSANLTKEKIPINPGTIYITTDEKRMYVDLGEERYRIGDFETYTTFAALKADSKNWTSDTLVYIKENNTLAKYDKETNTWIQINDTSTLQAALEAQINTLENTVTEHTSKISNIEAALGIDSPASGTENLISRIKAAEEEIDALQSEQTTQNDSIASVQTKAEINANAIKELTTSIETIKAQSNENQTNITTLTSAVTSNKADIENKLTNAVADLKGTKADGDTTDETIAGAKKYADDKIAVALQSADAMTFRGVLGDNDLTALPTDGVQAGDTYKVGVVGEYLEDGTKQYVGDLIIAKADQPLVDLEYKGGWYHISSGYEDDYDSYFKFENGIVKINGGDGQSNGSVTIKAVEGSGVTVTSSATGNGDVTSPSQAVFNIGFTWGTF